MHLIHDRISVRIRLPRGDIPRTEGTPEAHDEAVVVGP